MLQRQQAVLCPFHKGILCRAFPQFCCSSELMAVPVLARSETLARAGKAFEGLEVLLGGGRSGTFDLQVSTAPFRLVNTKLCWALPLPSMQPQDGLFAVNLPSMQPHSLLVKIDSVETLIFDGLLRFGLAWSPLDGCCPCAPGRATCGSARAGRRWTRCEPS